MFRKTRAAAIAAAAATALVLSACGGDSDTGSTGDGGEAGGDPIPVGIIADLTGATGDVGGPYNAGMLAYVEHLNANGGINGRELKAISNDYAYEVPRAEELYNQYVNDGVVAIQGWGTGDTEALSGSVANDELPFMSASYAEPLTDPEDAPYNFVVAPTYSDQIRVALNWINEDSGGSAEVAVLHHDSPFGNAPVADGQAWVEEKGYDLGYKAYPMPGGQPNYVGLLSQAQAQGAKYVIIQNVAPPAAQVAKDIQAQGLDMTIVCLNWCANELFISLAGEDVAEGHVLIQPITPMITEQPGHESIREYMEEKGMDESDVSVSWVAGWATMDVMAQGIAKALESGDELTGASIREALESMGPIDVGGLIGGGDVEFSAESHRGSASTGIYRAEGGQMVEIQGGVTP
ncbi:MAG: ABC transporter substrate-binding protein [Actinomycetales bacterium]|nr:ABC transporter substrate-binding protein [Tetrasphaera sp.]NLX00494.1 ABC transporter substrate-binding protein [Actinomycetales bacterium]